jgi:hypothetical protein
MTSRPALRVLDVRRVRKNSLRGFASIRLPNGLVVRDVMLGEINNRRWALLPSKPMIDHNGELLRDPSGKIRYAAVVEWGSKAVQQEFSRRIVAIIESQFPDVFDQRLPLLTGEPPHLSIAGSALSSPTITEPAESHRPSALPGLQINTVFDCASP